MSAYLFLTPSNVKVSMFRIRQKLKAGMEREAITKRKAGMQPEIEMTTTSTNEKP